MAVHANVFAHTAEAVTVFADGLRGLPYRIVVEDDHGTGLLHLSTPAAETLHSQLAALLHAADETARETAYQEQQVKDAVEQGLGTDEGADWSYSVEWIDPETAPQLSPADFIAGRSRATGEDL